MRPVRCWRGESNPLCKNLLTLALTVLDRFAGEGHILRERLPMAQRETRELVSVKQGKPRMAGSERSRYAEPVGVDIRSCFCVSPES